MSVQQKNWTDLPDDIKRTIFDFNRKDASIKKKQKQQNKKRYEMVVGDIKIQWEHSQDGVLIYHDEYGRQIDDIIPPPFVLKLKQEYKDGPRRVYTDGGLLEKDFFMSYHEYYPHINYDEFVVRFREAIQT